MTKPPPPGTSLESWRFITLLKAARSELRLTPATMGIASAQRITVLIEQSGLDEELWSRIPKHAAMTEASMGVSFRQLFCGQNAALIFEGLVDGPWEKRSTDRFGRPEPSPAARLMTFDQFCLEKVNACPVTDADPRYGSLVAAYGAYRQEANR